MIMQYKVLTDDGVRKLVEMTFTDPGYDQGDGTFRDTDVWDLPSETVVEEEVARWEAETAEIAARQVVVVQDAEPVALERDGDGKVVVPAAEVPVEEPV